MAAANLATLNGAIRANQPVAFGYTDLSGQETMRRVLPLALVHPAQGAKLLDWCEDRRDFRQFLLRAMQGLRSERVILARIVSRRCKASWTGKP